MSILNQTLVLNTLIKHETLTQVDLGKAENLGFVADAQHLQFLLQELEANAFIEKLDGTTAYTITDKGIEEGRRLNKA